MHSNTRLLTNQTGSNTVPFSVIVFSHGSSSASTDGEVVSRLSSVYESTSYSLTYECTILHPFCTVAISLREAFGFSLDESATVQVEPSWEADALQSYQFLSSPVLIMSNEKSLVLFNFGCPKQTAKGQHFYLHISFSQKPYFRGWPDLGMVDEKRLLSTQLGMFALEGQIDHPLVFRALTHDVASAGAHQVLEHAKLRVGFLHHMRISADKHPHVVGDRVFAELGADTRNVVEYLRSMLDRANDRVSGRAVHASHKSSTQELYDSLQRTLHEVEERIGLAKQRGGGNVAGGGSSGSSDNSSSSGSCSASGGGSAGGGSSSSSSNSSSSVYGGSCSTPAWRSSVGTSPLVVGGYAVYEYGPRIETPEGSERKKRRVQVQREDSLSSGTFVIAWEKHTVHEKLRDPLLQTQPDGRADSAFKKGACVEYLDKDVGDWVPATIVAVDKGVPGSPTYTVRIERKTAGSRLVPADQ
jgi:uncharacterized membrane protein YgcG